MSETTLSPNVVSLTKLDASILPLPDWLKPKVEAIVLRFHEIFNASITRASGVFSTLDNVYFCTSAECLTEWWIEYFTPIRDSVDFESTTIYDVIYAMYNEMILDRVV
jgi:hypothetical protein